MPGFKPAVNGRRTKFIVNEKVIEDIRILSNRGLNQTNIREYFGCSKTTWQRINRKYPEIREAYGKGKSKGISFAANKLMELIKIGNIDAIKFYLARIAKWSEKNILMPDDDEDESPKKQTTLVLTTTDPVEAAKVYQQFMQRSVKNERDSNSE